MGGGGGRSLFESDISDNTGGHRHSNLVNVFYIIPLLPDIGCFYKAKNYFIIEYAVSICFKKKIAEICKRINQLWEMGSVLLMDISVLKNTWLSNIFCNLKDFFYFSFHFWTGLHWILAVALLKLDM